ncbi:MAG TPA: DUF1592 domain-containing protein [Polyangia bacterium]|nr:DUF1592 domain-containing protein [Polyangia bacterium]
MVSLRALSVDAVGRALDWYVAEAARSASARPFPLEAVRALRAALGGSVAWTPSLFEASLAFGAVMHRMAQVAPEAPACNVGDVLVALPPPSDAPAWAFDARVDAATFAKLGFAATSAGIARVRENNAAGWASHAEQARAFIEAAAQRCPRRALAVVLGAGSGFDVPIAALASTFDRLVLVDVDRATVEAAVAALDATSRARIEIRAADLTGVNRALLATVDDLVASASTAADARTKIEAHVRAYRLAEPPAIFAPGERPDLVVSSCVLTQLAWPARAHAQDALARRFGAPFDDERSWAQAWAELELRMQQDHIASLAGAERAALVSDAVNHLTALDASGTERTTPRKVSPLGVETLLERVPRAFRVEAHARWWWPRHRPHGHEPGSLMSVEGVILFRHSPARRSTRFLVSDSTRSGTGPRTRSKNSAGSRPIPFVHHRLGGAMKLGAIAIAVGLASIGCTGSVGSNGSGGGAGTGGGLGQSNGGSGSAGTNGSGGTTSAGNGGSNATGGSTGSTPDNTPPLPGTSVVPQPTWRLTNVEYGNSVHDLLGLSTGLTVPLDPDGASGGYNAGLGAGDATIEAYHAAAVEIASQAMANVATLVPCTSAQITSMPAMCAAKFIDAWVPKAFRRPMDADTRTGLVNLYTLVSTQFGFNAGIQSIIEEVLQSSYFLYHLELEEEAQPPGKVAVTGYSMASRLSYLLWSSTPDDELLTKAGAGQLSTTAQIGAEVTRMLADPKAKIGLRNFYRQWLRVDSMMVSKTGKYATLYSQATQSSILASFDAQVDAALWATSGGLTTLLNGKQGFADANTASIFGAAAAGATGATLTPFTYDAHRAGILAHPAIMSTFATSNGTHPIKRGVFVWDQVLCQALPAPPPDVPTFDGPQPNESVRQAFTRFTLPPNSSCPACHTKIDPVGFLFESYDTVGAYQTIDDYGQPVNTDVTVVQAVDSSGNPDTTLNVETPDAVAFANNLAKDTAVPIQCLVQQLYQFALHRTLKDADAPVLAGLVQGYTKAAQSLPTLLGGLTQTESFLYRANVQ